LRAIVRGQAPDVTLESRDIVSCRSRLTARFPATPNSSWIRLFARWAPRPESRRWIQTHPRPAHSFRSDV